MRTWLLPVLMMILLVACGGRDELDLDRSYPEVKETRVAPYASDYLTSMLKPGTTREAVVNVFGKPLTEFNVDPGLVCLTYSSLIAGRDLPDEEHFVGFQVTLSNDLVMEWTPVLTAERSRKSTKPRSVPGQSETTSSNAVGAGKARTTALNLFVVSAAPLAGGRYINTERLPKLGYVARAPDLSVTRVVSLEQDTDGAGRYRLIVGLAKQDATSLQGLTAAHIGSQVVVMLGEQPVMTLAIETQIHTEQFLITSDDRNEVDLIYRALSQLANK